MTTLSSTGGDQAANLQGAARQTAIPGLKCDRAV